MIGERIDIEIDVEAVRQAAGRNFVPQRYPRSDRDPRLGSRSAGQSAFHHLIEEVSCDGARPCGRAKGTDERGVAGSSNLERDPNACLFGRGTCWPGRSPVPGGRRSVAAGTRYQAGGLHPLLGATTIAHSGRPR